MLLVLDTIFNLSVPKDRPEQMGVDPDQMLQNVADKDLHCLPLIWHVLDTSTGSKMD